MNTVYSLSHTEAMTIVAAIQAELELRREQLFKARELYNHALSAARSGAYLQAARYLEQAVRLDPEDPNIWSLKLKVDLKCHYYQRCYEDLYRLDKLAARPPEFFDLEQHLPATPTPA